MTNQQNVFCPKCHNTPQICRCSHESKKEWVGLTDDERDEIYNRHSAWVHAVEAKLKEKNS